jgi:hypothetical protein
MFSQQGYKIVIHVLTSKFSMRHLKFTKVENTSNLFLRGNIHEYLE